MKQRPTIGHRRRTTLVITAAIVLIVAATVAVAALATTTKRSPAARHASEFSPQNVPFPGTPNKPALPGIDTLLLTFDEMRSSTGIADLQPPAMRNTQPGISKEQVYPPQCGWVNALLHREFLDGSDWTALRGRP